MNMEELLEKWSERERRRLDFLYEKQKQSRHEPIQTAAMQETETVTGGVVYFLKFLVGGLIVFFILLGIIYLLIAPKN